MTTRVDINSSYFTPAERPETKEHVKGVLGYTWKITKGFASLFNLSFAIKDGQFNTGSLARYICEKYVSGQNPLQYKSLVRKAITHVLAKQRPDSLNDLIDAVLKLLAGKEVSAVLALGTNPKQVETKSQYNEISTLFDKILRAEKSKVHEISQKLNAEPSIELIREKTLGAADKLLNDTIFPQLKKLKLPESMEKILKKQPSFETYVEFVKTLRQLTGKTEHEIPDTLQNWQEVIKEATLLGELHSTIFPGLREIELLDPLARITKKLPSLATYKEFVKTLRQLTGKTEHEIPDNVENWEAVSAEANLLGQQYAATFLECAEAREKFQE